MTPEKRKFYIDYILKGKGTEKRKEDKARDDYVDKKVRRFENIEVGLTVARQSLKDWEGFVDKQAAEKIEQSLQGIETTLDQLTGAAAGEHKSGEIKAIEKKLAGIQSTIESAVTDARKKAGKEKSVQHFMKVLQEYKTDGRISTFFAAYLAKIETAITKLDFDEATKLFNVFPNMLEALKTLDSKTATPDYNPEKINAARKLLSDGKVKEALSQLETSETKAAPVAMPAVSLKEHVPATKELLQKRRDLEERLNIFVGTSMQIARRLEHYIGVLSGKLPSLDSAKGDKAAEGLKTKGNQLLELYEKDLTSIKDNSTKATAKIKDIKSYATDDVDKLANEMPKMESILDGKETAYASEPLNLSQWEQSVGLFSKQPAQPSGQNSLSSDKQATEKPTKAQQKELLGALEDFCKKLESADPKSAASKAFDKLRNRYDTLKTDAQKLPNTDALNIAKDSLKTLESDFSLWEFENRKSENAPTLKDFETYMKKIKSSLPKSVSENCDNILLAAKAMNGDASLQKYTGLQTGKLNALQKDFDTIKTSLKEAEKAVFLGDYALATSKLTELDDEAAPVSVDEAADQIAVISKILAEAKTKFREFGAKKADYEQRRLELVARLEQFASAHKDAYSKSLNAGASALPNAGKGFKTYAEFTSAQNVLDELAAQLNAINDSADPAKYIADKAAALKKEEIKKNKLKIVWENTSGEFNSIRKKTTDVIKTAGGDLSQVKQLDTLKKQADEVANNGNYTTALQILDEIRAYARYLQNCPGGLMMHTRKQLESDVKAFAGYRNDLRATLNQVASSIALLNETAAEKIKGFPDLLETSVLDDASRYNEKPAGDKAKHNAEIRRLREIHMKEIGRLQSILESHPLAAKIRSCPVHRADISRRFENLFIILDSLAGNIVTAV